MKIYKLYAAAGICLFALFWFLFSTIWNSHPVENHINSKLELIESRNDSLIKMNELKNFKNQQLVEQSDSLKVLLKKDQQLISNLKKNKIEKSNIISTYDVDELYRFFSEFKTRHPSIQE